MKRKTIGEKLVELRGERTQSDVAKACNISAAAVGMYERNERVPRDEIKIALARFFNVTVESLFYA